MMMLNGINYIKLKIKIMDYEKIKSKLLEIQEMLHEIPYDCKGMSDTAHDNRIKYLKVKKGIYNLIEIL